MGREGLVKNPVGGHLNGVPDNFIEELRGDNRPEKKNHGGLEHSSDGRDARRQQRGHRQREQAKAQSVARETSTGDPRAADELPHAQHAVEQPEERGELLFIGKTAFHVFIEKIVDEVFAKEGEHGHAEEKREITILEQAQPRLAFFGFLCMFAGLLDGKTAQRVDEEKNIRDGRGGGDEQERQRPAALDDERHRESAEHPRDNFANGDHAEEALALAHVEQQPGQRPEFEIHQRPVNVLPDHHAKDDGVGLRRREAEIKRQRDRGKKTQRDRQQRLDRDARLHPRIDQTDDGADDRRGDINERKLLDGKPAEEQSICGRLQQDARGTLEK